WTKARPPATTGELYAWPTLARHRTFSASPFFQGATFSLVPPSRFGPSHCGQSAALAPAETTTRTRTARSRTMVASSRRSGEVDVGLAVLGVFLAQPAEELAVVTIAPVAAVGGRVVAQVE